MATAGRLRRVGMSLRISAITSSENGGQSVQLSMLSGSRLGTCALANSARGSL